MLLGVAFSSIFYVNLYSNCRQDAEVSAKVYVGGIPYYSTEDDIRSYFEGCGTIINVDCMLFPDTGKFRGIAIITFKVCCSLTGWSIVFIYFKYIWLMVSCPSMECGHCPNEINIKLMNCNLHIKKQLRKELKETIILLTFDLEYFNNPTSPPPQCKVNFQMNMFTFSLLFCLSILESELVVKNIEN